MFEQQHQAAFLCHNGRGIDRNAGTRMVDLVIGIAKSYDSPTTEALVGTMLSRPINDSCTIPHLKTTGSFYFPALPLNLFLYERKHGSGNPDTVLECKKFVCLIIVQCCLPHVAALCTCSGGSKLCTNFSEAMLQ